MFKEIDIRELGRSPVRLFADDWALLTAGSPEDWNTMTVSWGAIGELWNRDVAFVFVRPQRYTRIFMERYDVFTLSFFDGAFKKELSLCGARSGRDTDKMKETGLVPVRAAGETVTFRQAKRVLVCKKIAFRDFSPAGFLDSSVVDLYPDKDYHRMYVGTIEKALILDEFTKN